MTDQKVLFYPRLAFNTTKVGDMIEDSPHIETGTCVEAETFVLQVLDDSMEPEFRKGCMIVIDPTGRATNGCYVLARRPVSKASSGESVDDYLFRQLRGSESTGWTLHILNPEYGAVEGLAVSMSDVVGVIVQRAGIRRRYHKHYS